MDEAHSKQSERPTPGQAAEKLARLEALLAPVRKVVLAFSGGVDSTFLLAVLRKDPGRKVISVTALSPAHPEQEKEGAREMARLLSAEHREIAGDETRLEAFRSNPPDRCYHCKKHLFSKIEEVRVQEGCEVVLDGSNADDLSDFRPGIRALQELGVRSPLQEAGLTKAEIRALSQEMGLRTWNRPSLACLASRIPYGTEITEKALARIDRCEAFLLERVQGPVRVRYHGNLARIEVPPEAISKILGQSGDVVRFFREQGFAYVTVDLQGYRTGSMNEVLEQKRREDP
jgi:pyridinium-3,5-biscarboxylic acid mononucleotide sulfurtransferase